MKDYNGKVRVVFKNLVVHPQVVTRAHLAGCAAANQGKFTEFYMAFWEKSYKPYSESRDATKLSEEAIFGWAPSIGLDVAKLKADMDGAECKALLDADAAELRKFRVNSTPSFFINGTYVAGAMDVDGFKRIIDGKLKLAEATGTSAAEFYDKEIIGKGEKQFRASGTPKP